jgi:hypothetical protein
VEHTASIFCSEGGKINDTRKSRESPTKQYGEINQKNKNKNKRYAFGIACIQTIFFLLNTFLQESRMSLNGI